MAPLGKPRQQPRLGLAQVGAGDTQALKAQLPPPVLDRRGQRRAVEAAIRSKEFRVHDAHDSDSPPGAALFLPDEAATLAAGAALAGALAPGARIYLSGDLGAGKTTLVRGLLRRLGFEGKVRSPTFTLVDVYAISNLDLYHFDFYRLNDPAEWEEAGFREYFGPASVCLVEWPERAGGLLPPADLELRLSLADAGRNLEVRATTPAGRRLLAALTAMDS